MNNLKLIKILSTFSKDEWKDFKKFVASPYFNKGRNYLPLLNELNRFYPEFNSVEFTSENIYSKLFRGKEHNRNVIKTMFVGLNGLAEKFLIQKGSEEDPLTENIILLRQLSARNLDGLHYKILSDLYSGLPLQNVNMGIFDTLYRIQYHKVEHSMKGNYEKSISESIPTRADYLIFSFIFKILNEVRDLIVMKDSYNITTQKDLSRQIYNALDIKSIIEYTVKYYPDLSPTISTLINCYTASITIDEKNYFEAKKLMYENYQLFDKSFLMEIIKLMEGAASIRLRSGNRLFVREWHEIHRFLKNNCLQIFQTLNPLTADNMLALAFWNKEYNWIEEFLRDHQNDIQNEYKNYLNIIGKIYIHFSVNEFREALTKLSEIDDKLFPFKHKVRLLKLQIYYELDEFELALNGIDSYSKFITNNKKYDERTKHVSLVFVSMYKQLLLFKMKKTGNLKQLRIKILNEVPSQGLDWIIEKINELENS